MFLLIKFFQTHSFKLLDPVYTGAKWNRSKIVMNGPCVYIRTVGTVPFGTAIRSLLAPLKERFHLRTFRLVPV